MQQLIHEWKATICAHSKWKEDLVHIRDMHRLLSYKGTFPPFALAFRPSSFSVLVLGWLG